MTFVLTLNIPTMESSSGFILRILIVTFLLLRSQGNNTVSSNGCANKSARWEDLGGDFCYILEINKKVSWMDAAYECFIEGGSLASFHDIDELRRVVNEINHVDEVSLHIGLWKLYDGSLEWVDKSSFDFRNWNQGEPNSASSVEKCGVMYTHSGKWNDVECNAEFGYVCSYPKASLGESPSGKEKLCPFSSLRWTDLGGDFCYIIERHEKVAWNDASSFCTEKGGSLASFHNIGEISAVLRRIKGYDEGLYIGLQQTANGKYQWADGSPVDLDYWTSGEPRNSQTCAEMTLPRGQWNAATCSKTSGYICSASKSFCGGDIYSDIGILYTPHFPGFYRSNSECTWYITVQEGYQVAFQFSVFEVEFSPGCQKDSVTILDGHEPGSAVLEKYCGIMSTTVIHSSGNKMAVKFVSDSSFEGIGFYANFLKVSVCGGNISSENGTIKSPNYPSFYGPGTKCVWNIEVEQGYKISLRFVVFNLEYSLSCRNDFVEVRDGHEASSSRLARHCGSELLDDIVSSENKMTIEFVSNFGVEGAGFLAEFRKDTCGGEIVSESGTISSPNFPGNYRMNEDCTWEITVPENYRVALQFKTFELQADKCTRDFVEITYAQDSGISVLKRICEVEENKVYRSSTNKMTLRFVSDLSEQRRGFTAAFAKGNICEKEIFAEKGVIHSPNFPNNYGPGEKCVWKITVPEGNRILLTFKTFAIKSSTMCGEDFIKIVDGHDMMRTILHEQCGNVLPDVFLSDTNSLAVIFESNLWPSDERTGFSAEFEMRSCGGEYFSDNGNITSPDFPENYKKNENCAWKITVAEDHQVVLHFLAFDLEFHESCVYDFVEIRDGHEPDSLLLARFCGTELPDDVRSTANQMSITLISDASYHRAGFFATFKKDETPVNILRGVVEELPSVFMRSKLPKVIERMNSGSKPKKSFRDLLKFV